MKQRELVVYHAAFVPSTVCAEPTLVAATSTGELHVFQLGNVLRPEYWEQVDVAQEPRQPTAAYSFQAHSSQIYSLAFAGDDADPLLVSGGDQDFRVWRWKDIAERMRHESTGAIEPVYQAHLQRKAMGFRGALLPFSEINSIATTRHDPSRVFLAGGDGLAHEWDLASLQCARQYEGHRDYLHAVQYVSHSKELITGSEDGTVAIWDARSAKRTDELRPSHGSSGLWVGSVTTDSSETWLACGGGGISTSKAASTGGFVSMWHLPSRVPVHFTATGLADVHDLAFHTTSLLTVGNEPQLKTWNRSSGSLLSAARCSVPSAQFCVVDAATDLIALGGHSNVVDVCMMPGVVSFSLQLGGL
ncbi:hypothetical protein P43SY_000132 [Pythium insidiosum]|uniref:THO complex subunit 6 n=1 Tax=Pythium insidiosum TaxID=114742 RepID=A0AAD5M1E1_PYTIN|nr:hypothetical protein P43SY_000132 [Pythium insidiosum]